MASPPRSESFSGSYESSDYEHDHDRAQYSDQDESHNGVSTGTTESMNKQKANPPSDQKHLSNGTGRPKQKRPTHFVCFPLVTNTSIPQLAESLRRFREVTTAPPPLRPSQIQRQEREREMETPDREVEAEENGQDKHAEGERIKVIPQAAHRPPGTFHLTIGTMDLSEKSEMRRALGVLKSIDYAAMLRAIDSVQAQNGHGSSMKAIAMDATRPETSNSSNSTLNANMSNTQSEPTKHKVQNGTGEGYRDTVSRIDRAILHATPDAPSYKRENRERNPDPYRETVSKIDRAILHATPDIPSPGQQKREIGSSNGIRSANGNAVPSRNTDAKGTTIPTSLAIGSHSPRMQPQHQRGGSTDLYGRSGYKETVSTVDRYVDKTYAKANKVKRAVKSPLKSLKRDVSPPRSLASTTNQRLLSIDSSRMGSSVGGGSGGDGGSLYTVTSKGSTATERPAPIQEERKSTPAVSVGMVSTTGPGTSTPTTGSNTPPLTVTLKGLGAFQSPRKARVFYAPPVDPEGKLSAFANAIRQIFKDEGLVNEERALTLHATVANMTYAAKSNHHHGRGGRGGKGGQGKWRGGMRTVDGTGVVEMCNGGDGEGWVWADGVHVDRVRICKMGAERSDDEVLGMVYPAVEVELDGEEEMDEGRAVVNGKAKEKAEVVFA